MTYPKVSNGDPLFDKILKNAWQTAVLKIFDLRFYQFETVTILYCLKHTHWARKSSFLFCYCTESLLQSVNLPISPQSPKRNWLSDRFEGPLADMTHQQPRPSEGASRMAAQPTLSTISSKDKDTYDGLQSEQQRQPPSKTQPSRRAWNEYYMQLDTQA